MRTDFSPSNNSVFLSAADQNVPAYFQAPARRWSQSTLKSMNASAEIGLGFCSCLWDLLKALFPWFFTTGDTHRSSTSQSVNTSSGTSTTLPQTQATTSTSTASTSTTAITSTAAITSTTAATSRSITTLEGRIAAAKNIILEHLGRNDHLRNYNINRRTPRDKLGVIIRLRYNGQEHAFVQTLSHFDTNANFLESQIRAFLGHPANASHSDDSLLIHTVLFQRKSAYMFAYDNPFAEMTFPEGRISPGRDSFPAQEASAFMDMMNYFVRNEPQRQAIRNFIAALPS